MPAGWTDWLTWLEAIEDDGVGLTPWEEEFVQSIRAKYDTWEDRYPLSDATVDVLERIYTQRVP